MGNPDPSKKIAAQLGRAVAAAAKAKPPTPEQVARSKAATAKVSTDLGRAVAAVVAERRKGKP